jgi:integrase
MPDKRITVWVQRFKDRDTLMLQWLDPETGRRKSKSAETADPKEAEEKRADLEYELNHGLHREPSQLSWERFRELFERQYLPNVRPSTQRNYRNVLDLFEQICKPKRPWSITARTLTAFVAGLREVRVYGRKGMVPSTISVRLQFLHSVLGWASTQGFLAKLPEFPEVRVPKKKPKAVPTEAFEKMYDKARDVQMKTFLLCAWLAGLRLAEAIRLDREETDEAPWVDFGRDRIWLPAEMVKADEDQWVPLDPVLRRALLALPRQGRKFFRFAAHDGHAINDNAVAARISRLARQAGVKLTMRVLRRGFGCRYAARVPAQVLQRLMRHASITTTMTFYANVDDAVEEAVLGKRNTLCNTPSPRTAGEARDGVGGQGLPQPLEQAPGEVSGRAPEAAEEKTHVGD